jgi:hypothetical protein
MACDDQAKIVRIIRELEQWRADHGIVDEEGRASEQPLGFDVVRSSILVRPSCGSWFTDFPASECSTRSESVRVLAVGPHREGLPIGTLQQHLRPFALFAELLGGVNREQHCFPFGLVRPVLFFIELNEPEIFLTYDEVAPMLMASPKFSLANRAKG